MTVGCVLHSMTAQIEASPRSKPRNCVDAEAAQVISESTIKNSTGQDLV